MRKTRIKGFSLLEVILAVGVLSLAVIALIGIVGPLVRGLSEDETKGELEAILASIRQWSAQEASDGNYESFRRELQETTNRFVYRLQSADIREGGWVVAKEPVFASDLSGATADRFVRGPIACYINLESEFNANPPAQPPETYEPFLIRIWLGGLPEPGRSLQDWAQSLQASPPDFTVRYVIHR